MTEEENWLEKLSKMHIAAGNYIPLANHVKYVFTINDIRKEPEKVEKTFEGKAAGFKWAWNIHLVGAGFLDTVDAQYLKKHNEKKFNAIKDLKKDNDYELELSATATKQLSTFLIENEAGEATVISFIRTGEKAQTKYAFILGA